ncbi:hypothetical protein FACS1894181_15260 [Bacteroidia bacterium]|nr:hypothetical protein FACS1894181_15260 [Bacteroidia bacterium]
MRKLLFYIALLSVLVLPGCVDKIIPLTGSMHGIVKDADTSFPVEGCLVTIVPTGASVTTGADGMFSFQSLDPGDYRVAVVNNSYMANSKIITVTAGYSLAADLLLEKKLPGTITGVVKDVDSGAALQGCTLTLRQTGSTSQSSADGVYLFENVMPGNYVIEANMAGYYINSKSVILPSGGNMVADILLMKRNATTGSVRGEVKDAATSETLAGCTVTLEPGGATSTTDAGGIFQFNNVAPGNYTVEAARSEYNKNSKSIVISAGITLTADILLAKSVPASLLPALNKLKATDISTNSIRVESEVTNAGNSPVSERGFVFSQTSNPQVGVATKAVVSGTTGVMSTTISGLKENTDYYLAAYATNNSGTAYSEQVRAKTKASAAAQNIIYVSISGNDANDGSSWAKSKRTIAEAINISTSGKQIWVSLGTYNETVRPKSGVPLYGGFTGTETTVAERTQKTSAKGLSCPVFAVSTTINGFIFSGQLTLRDYAKLENSIISDINFSTGDGAIVNVACQNKGVVMENCIINHNSPGRYDGVVSVENSESSLAMVNCRMQGNNGTAITVNGFLEMYNCVVANNSEGVRINSGSGEFYNCTLASNLNNGLDGAAVLNNCLLWNNPAKGTISKNFSMIVESSNNNDIKLKKPSATKGASAADWQTADWSLAAGSACINAGANLLYPISKYPKDIAGNPRIKGNAIDVGAYEY